MLFNSPEFIFVFLPIVVAGFYLLRAWSFLAAFYWLLALSFVFYSWTVPWFLLVIIGSILFNYTLGVAIDATPAPQRRWATTALAIAANLLLLGYFKYAAFFSNNIWWLVGGADSDLAKLTLPLGISFFTFQSIAYLVDIYKGQRAEWQLQKYALLIGFFPHSIAGPIVHPNEVLPQFNAQQMKFRPTDLSVGLTFFAIGLFKKVVFADTAALFATPVFHAFAVGKSVTFSEAWVGAIAYTMQIYFDFSAYSDMAIGFARIFGVRFPLNFFSPYKATSIIDFWRRWHITLSRWLRDYLYIPLGGNRHGKVRRYTNLFVTMLLGGLWHGANWTFVVWGGLHGIYLIVNHLWDAARSRHFPNAPSNAPTHLLAGTITFLSVVVAWVFFRAESFDAALSMLATMFGGAGIGLPARFASGAFGYLEVFAPLRFDGAFTNGLFDASKVYWLVVMLAVVWLLPNSAELTRRYRPVADSEPFKCPRGGQLLLWRANQAWGVATAVILLVALLNIGKVSEFIYFNF